MLLLSCFRTAITHLAVKLRIRHVGTWRAQCLTCLYVVLINSFFFLSHSPSLSSLSQLASVVLLVSGCDLRSSASSFAAAAMLRHGTTHLLLVFPFWARFCCLRLQLDELFSKINPWQATKCNYTGALRSLLRTLPQSASACTLIIVNRQPIASSPLPSALAHCKCAPSSARVLSPSAAWGGGGVHLSVGVRLLLNSFDFRAF